MAKVLYYDPIGEKLILSPTDPTKLMQDESGEPCCCNNCCCEFFNEEFPPPLELLLTIDAPSCPAIDGATCTLALTELDGCVSYRAQSCTVGTCVSVPIPVTFTLTCPQIGVGCDSFTLDVVPGSSDCSGDSAFTDKLVTTCACEPFELVFTGFKLVNSAFGTQCDCCASYSVIVTEVP